jgi:DNA-binding transcriptional ArsR family regulator
MAALGHHARRLTSRKYNRMDVVMPFAPPDLDRLFGALADPTRRDIVRRAIDGEEGVAEVVGRYPMSVAAVQKHVAILERVGLVAEARVGRRKVVRAELPVTTMRVTIRDLGGGRTRMSIESAFPTLEAMEQLAATGTEAGRRRAVGQIDALLAEEPAGAGRGRR